MAQLTVDQWLDIAKTIGTIIGLFGGGAVIANRINKNYNDKFDAERKEREQIESARAAEMVLVHEGLTAVGHVARITAEEHVAKCGPNEKIKNALAYHDKFREKEDAQMRNNAATRLHCEGNR